MPSLASTYASTPLTNAERVDVRRFCGYALYGPENSNFNGWRFFQAAGTLEYRLTNMAPEEFQVTRQKLSDLYTLEQDIVAVTSGLSVDTAAVFKRNKAELSERKELYAFQRTEFCNFLGIPTGPQFGGTLSNAIVI